MADCTGCGTPLPNDAGFCPQCGRETVAQPALSPALAAAIPARSAVPAPVPMPATGLGTISDVRTMAGAGVAKAAATLAEGDVFHGRYVIARQLGAGAMGVVYAAQDQVTGRTVALKLINPALADRPTARERFLREGLMARDIRHANIVAMYDVGEVAGQVYLVMEYLGGETLRTWLHRALQDGRDLPFDTARGIIRAVLQGLVAAHATGVVHRDLKPENVILTGDPHQGDFGLKILDFGIARAVGTASHVTTTSSSTGTPLYMAPEQKTAADTVGPPADLYAVTAMLYELLLGVAPEGRWGAPSRERHDLPPGIDAIIETGLANRPRSRYQSADEYIRALDGIGAATVQTPAAPPRPVAPPVAPVRPPDTAPGTGWLKARSPGWALWQRMSKPQRYVSIGVSVFLVLAAISYYAGPDRSEPGASPKPQPGPTVQAPMNVAGRWSDEVAGTGVLAAYVDFYQQGNAVNGVIWTNTGLHAGTFSGGVQGTTLEYAYVADNGATGTGRGVLTADGSHLDLKVQDTATGHTERHTLHRNHLPNQ